MKHRRGDGSCSTTVDLAGPLDVAASVEVFRRAGDDLIDRWDGATLLRTVRVAGESIPVACTPLGSVEQPSMRVATNDPRHLDAAARAAASFFATVPRQTLESLTDRDPVIRAADRLHHGVRTVLQPDVLTGLVRAVSAQQINLRFAATVRARLARRYGRRHEVEGHEVWSLEPDVLAAARAADLRELQFTTRKAGYIIGIASAVAGGTLDAAQLAERSDEEVVAELVTLPGIGRWTAEWLLARSFGRPVVVAGDLGVRKAVGHAYREGAMPSEEEVRELTAHWRDAAGVAQQLLLHVLAGDEWQQLRELSAAAGR
ncbi:MAG TPA: hypothetical protein VFC09_03280 [Candidatus Dormibacteraeota bacterium]|nr:hypothetical protein [Candidatus Dormibacteraeota bacterium]